MKIGIIGSRLFNDYDKFLDILRLFSISCSDEIISGGARGADSLAERYAEYYGIPIKVFKADWNKYGKRAGFLRNTDIVKESDMIIAFWDGQSRGTKDSLDKAKLFKKSTFIVYI